MLVEGETEEAAMPIFYRKKYNKTLTQDGIKLINLAGCDSWQSIIKTLLNSRSEHIHFLLDKDCQTNKSLSIKESTLKNLGFGDCNIESQITFVGKEKEFEDEFENAFLLKAIRRKFPSIASQKWQQINFEELRQNKKFSDAFVKKVSHITYNNLKDGFSKPKLGELLADYCTVKQIPDSIITAFEALRNKIGLNR